MQGLAGQATRTYHQLWKKMCLVEPVETPSWYTKRGIVLMHRQLRRRGLPDSGNWRMFTLTLDPKLFPNRHSGYQKGKNRLREWLKIMAEKVYGEKPKWAWKLEFHENGWTHWHVFVGYTRKLTREQMDIATAAWGLGRVNVRRVPKYHDQLSYALKYAFKHPQAVDGDGNEIYAPDWWLNLRTSKTIRLDGENVQKPLTAANFRIWQTCKDFYTNWRPSKPAGKNEAKTGRRVLTLREKLDWISRKIRVSYRAFGTLMGSEITAWKGSWQEMHRFFFDLFLKILGEYRDSGFDVSIEEIREQSWLRKQQKDWDRVPEWRSSSTNFHRRMELAPPSSCAGMLVAGVTPA